MACDIALINPPLSLQERYGDFAELGSCVPPLGLCTIASVVRAAGFRVRIIDAPALHMNEQQVVDEVKRTRPEFVGITAVTNSIPSVYTLVRAIKEYSLKVKTIIGGPHITALPEQTCKECKDIDIGVIGEGEDSIVEILSGTALENIQGIVFRENGQIHRTPQRAYIQNLDRLPFPAWDLLPYLPHYYRPSPHSYLRLPSSSLVTSRGCSGKCIFCVRSLSGKTLRAHSADYTLAMIEHLVRKYHIRDIIFYDDNFLIDKNRAAAIFEALIRKKIDISWSCLARPEIISAELLELMKRSGCWQIAFGIESGDQRVLDILKKNVRVEKVEEVLQQTSRAGIKTRGYFMIGVPGETEESIEKTIAFAKRACLNDFHVTFFTPFPGSEIYATANEYGEWNRQWSSMSAWNPVFIPRGLTRQMLKKMHRKMYRSFYFRPRVFIDYAGRFLFHPKLFFRTGKAGFSVLRYSFFNPDT